MKLNFSKEQTFVPTFNDNRELEANKQIVIKHGVLEFGRLLEIMEVLQEQGFDKVDTAELDTNDPETFSKIKAILEASEDVVTKHVKEIKNLETNDGAITDPADLTKYSPLVPLGFECLIEIVNASSPTEDDAGN